MTDVAQILSQVEQGDPSAAEQLLPLVYNELRKLAASKLAQEKPGQTLQATALVHEAYLRLLGDETDKQWNGKSHFFGAAAEAMRRVLVDQARHKRSLRAGGGHQKIRLSVVDPETPGSEVDLIALDEALEHLEARDTRACSVVKLRFFAGLTIPQVAETLGVSTSTVENDWAYARAWLKKTLGVGHATQ